MDKKVFFIWVVSVALVASLGLNVYFGKDIAKIYKAEEQKQEVCKFMIFRNMFVEKVLLADGDVDFEARLSLEAAARALNNPETFAKWQAFVNSKDQETASATAKALLRDLIEKTSSILSPAVF